jgi:cytochrome c553
MYRRLLSALFLLLLSALAVPAAAVDTTAIQDKLPLCESCHSKDGISLAPNTPSLAGQPDQYLQWQLVFFRAGTRKSDQMAPIAADMGKALGSSPQEIGWIIGLLFIAPTLGSTLV